MAVVAQCLDKSFVAPVSISCSSSRYFSLLLDPLWIFENLGATHVTPLALQVMPAVAQFVFMLLCKESPRSLANQHEWKDAHKVLARFRALPLSHHYVGAKVTNIGLAIEAENRLMAGCSWWQLQREVWTLPGNCERAIVSSTVMTCQ